MNPFLFRVLGRGSVPIFCGLGRSRFGLLLFCWRRFFSFRFRFFRRRFGFLFVLFLRRRFLLFRRRLLLRFGLSRLRDWLTWCFAWFANKGDFIPNVYFAAFFDMNLGKCPIFVRYLFYCR